MLSSVYLVDVRLLLLGSHQLPLIGDHAEDLALLGLLAELLANLLKTTRNGGAME